jgi:glycerophosphoryl diester phosphodiesterase
MKITTWSLASIALALASVVGCHDSLAGMSVASKDTTMFDLQAHRGGRGLRPENTLASFRNALRLGVSTLELDCGVTRDGVVIVSHDARLNPDITRGPDGKFLESRGEPIVALAYADLARYDVGRIKPASAYAASFPEQQPSDGERIPRLADVFALVEVSGNTSVRFNIETKIDPTDPEGTVAPDRFVLALLAAIRGAGMGPRVTIQSFDWRTLVLVKKVAPEIATVALTDQQPGEDTMEVGKPGTSIWLGGIDVDDHGGSVPKTVAALGTATWSPHALDLTPESIAEAHALGLKIVPWTVNEPKDMARVIAAGVDGLITDYPDRLRALLVSKGIAVPAPTPAK